MPYAETILSVSIDHNFEEINLFRHMIETYVQTFISGGSFKWAVEAANVMALNILLQTSILTGDQTKFGF